MTIRLLNHLRDRAARLLLTTKARVAEDALRASELQRRQSEERLALALDSGEGGIWDWDLSLNHLWISECWLGRLGYVGTEPDAHHPINRILHPADRERATTALFAHLKGLTATFECEHQIVRSDGSVGWVLTRGRVVRRDFNGRALRVVGTQIDIDQRWKVEQALRTSESRLRLSEERLALALDSGEDGLIDNDFVHGTNWVSLPWVKHLGYPTDFCDYPPSFWQNAVHPDDAEALARDVTAHFEGRTAGIENEHRLRRADGSYIWTLMRARVAGRSENGAPHRLVVRV